MSGSSDYLSSRYIKFYTNDGPIYNVSGSVVRWTELKTYIRPSSTSTSGSVFANYTNIVYPGLAGTLSSKTSSIGFGSQTKTPPSAAS